MVLYGVDADAQLCSSLLIAFTLPAAELVDFSTLWGERVQRLVHQGVQLMQGGGGPILLICKGRVMENELLQQVAFARYFQGGVIGLIVTDAEEVG